MKKENLQRINVLNNDKLEKFSIPFSGFTAVPNGISHPPVVRVGSEMTEILTTSEYLKGKVKAVDCCSGALKMSGTNLSGSGLVVYREAEGKAFEKGYNYSADVYQITDTILLKLKEPFQNHWLKNLPQIDNIPIGL